MVGKPRVLSLSSIRLINSIKHEHECIILYIKYKTCICLLLIVVFVVLFFYQTGPGITIPYYS